MEKTLIVGRLLNRFPIYLWNSQHITPPTTSRWCTTSWPR